jgi:hypothetical protein
MRWPFVTRKEHDKIVLEFEARLHDLERHFVTKRDPATGQILETLADRSERKFKPKRVTWQQTRAWLEATDDGRRKGPAAPPEIAHAVKMASKAEEKAANGESTGS